MHYIIDLISKKYSNTTLTIKSVIHYRKWVIRSKFSDLYSINGQNASMADFVCSKSAGNFTSSTAGN